MHTSARRSAMGWQIYKQDNGKYSIWSSIIDDWVCEDCDRNDLIKAFVGRKKEDIVRMIDKRLNELG